MLIETVTQFPVAQKVDCIEDVTFSLRLFDTERFGSGLKFFGSPLNCSVKKWILIVFSTALLISACFCLTMRSMPALMMAQASLKYCAESPDNTLNDSPVLIYPHSPSCHNSLSRSSRWTFSIAVETAAWSLSVCSKSKRNGPLDGRQNAGQILSSLGSHNGVQGSLSTACASVNSSDIRL